MDRPRHPLWLHGAAAIATALIALAGCSPDTAEPSATHGRVLGPGSSLFDDLAALRVVGHPLSNMPMTTRKPIADLLAGFEWDVPTSAWMPIPPGDIEPDLARLLSVLTQALPELTSIGTQVWQTAFEVPPDLKLGRFELRHDGRLLSRFDDAEVLGRSVATYMVWIDGSTKTVLCWEPAESRVLAIGAARPRTVSCRYVPNESATFCRLEWRLATHAEAPATAEPLRCDIDLLGTYRKALLAPAPTTLVMPVSRLDGDTLRIAVGVADYGLVAMGNSLRAVTGRCDGVTFAVDIAQAGRVERCWSRTVQVGDGFVEHDLDLSRWEGESFELHLSTEPGPGGQSTFDYALWADLRILGDQRPSQRQPHVVLIDVDTLRQDRLGCYGYERETSPRIDAWAESVATLYSDSTSLGNWTLPSTVSMLTGLAPQQHQVLAISRSMGASHRPLAMVLQDAGYDTIGQTDGGFLVPSFGFALGFDSFEVKPRAYDNLSETSWAGLLDKLDRRRNGAPVFAFVQTYYVHTPFRRDRRFDQVDQPYHGRFDAENISDQLLLAHQRGRRPPGATDLRWINAQYDAAVRRMDTVVGGFLESLPDIFGDDPYMVVFTSDHGEEIFERDAYGHRRTLYDELLKVPLIIQYPRQQTAATVSAPTWGLDIVPTILDVVGLDIPDALMGLPLNASLPNHRPRLALHEQSKQALLYAKYKLIIPTSSQQETGSAPEGMLFNLSTDPLELKNVMEQQPLKSTQLRSILDQVLEGIPSVEAAATNLLDDGLLDDLMALGYLGGG